MTDKADYTGQLNAKKLTGTGITEAMLGRHHRAESGRVVIVASASVAGISKNVKEGTGQVHYVIDDLEVAPSAAEDHVRNLIRSFNYERLLEQNGPTLPLEDERGDEPTVEQVVAAGGRFEPHPFLPVDASDDTPICDVCGLVEDAGPHQQDHADDDAEDDQPDFLDDEPAEELEDDEEPALT